MGSLCWMLLLFSLSAGPSSAVQLDDLQTIVQSIRENYLIVNTQFSVAMNVPTNPALRPAAFNADPSATVIATVTAGRVYQRSGTNVVEATPRDRVDPKTKVPYTEHAEARVLDNTAGLASRPDNNIMLFYTYLSPCNDRCMNPDKRENIIRKLGNLFGYTHPDKAFVFTKVYDTQNVEQSLNTLGGAVGHQRVFRCFFPLNQNARCVACFTRDAAGAQQLSNQCISN